MKPLITSLIKIKNYLLRFCLYILCIKTCVLILSCANSSKIETQDDYFIETFGGSADDYGYSVQQTFDGGFIITGGTSSFGAGFDDVYLIKTDNYGNLEWWKTFGRAFYDCGYSIQQTSDKGFIIAGWTRSVAAGTDDVYLIKTDNSGNEIWSKILGQKSSDNGYSVQQTFDGGYIITGYTEVKAGDEDVYLLKTDSSGNEIWSNIIGGADNESGFSCKQTFDGGFIIAGGTHSFGAGSRDVYLIKTDISGNEEWSKTFGGNKIDCGCSVQQTSDHGFIIIGFSTSFSTGDYEVYIIKTDGTGNQMWSKTFGGEKDDYGISGQQTSDGGFIITGRTNSFGSGISNYGVYLIKTDNSGNEVWSKTYYGNTLNEYQSGSCVQQTSDGGFIIVGLQHYETYPGNVLLIKTDENGNIDKRMIF